MEDLDIIKQKLSRNWELVESDITSKDVKYYRTIFPEAKIEIRTCLFGNIKNRSIEFVYSHNITTNNTKKNVELKGLNLEFFEDDENKKKIICLKLKSNYLFDIYLEFIASIIKSISTLDSEKVVVNEVIKKINIWIKFFRKERFEGLSEEEVRGLIGELLFIKKLSLKKEDFKKNINQWKGCENGLHDFDFKDKKAEIKTFAKNGIIRISIPDQLDIEKNKNIYLICFGLLKKDGQFSLNDLIEEIKEKLDDDLSFIFKDKLKSYGYFEIHKNDYNEKYRNFDEHFYKITSEFPKILNKDTQSGITNITYGLDTNLLSSFDIGKNKIKEVFTDEKN